MAEELSTYVCTNPTCNAPHNNPKNITVCRSCGGYGTVKIRPMFAVESPKEKPQPQRCICGGDHSPIDENGNTCAVMMEGAIFHIPRQRT